MRILKQLMGGFALLATMAGSAQAALLYGTVGKGGAISDLVTVNATTGATTQIGSIGFAVNDIDYYNGTLYATERRGGFGFGGRLISINTTTGVGTAIGALGTNISSLDIDSSGNAWGWSESCDCLASINLATGAATLVSGGPTIGSAAHGLAHIGSTLYFNNVGQIYTLQPGVGATLIGDSGQYDIHGDVNPDDGMYYGAGSPFDALDTIGKVDLVNATYLSTVSADRELFSLAFVDGATVPEPATLSLMALSLFGLGLRRRKKA